ncbi:MAG: hypothetical protein ABSG53_32945 [Thermoguttaceae bacterium]
MALQTEDEPPVAAAESNVESDAGSAPPTVAEDVPPTDHSGDGNHRENT